MNPIEIMDEIERASRPTFLMTAMRVGLQGSEQWQSLRAAIEAQAEELAQKDAQKDARIARLEDEISITLIALFNSYDHPTDTSTGIKGVVDRLSAALKESPAQSAAHLKAEALREAAVEKRDEAASAKNELQPHKPFLVEAQWLEKRADCIEREAKQS